VIRTGRRHLDPVARRFTALSGMTPIRSLKAWRRPTRQCSYAMRL